MKKTLTFSCALMALVCLSCNKQLSPAPQDFMTPTYYFNTEQELTNAATGVYDALGSNYVYSGDCLLTNFDTSDQFYLPSTATTGRPDFYRYGAGDSWPTGLWQSLYKGVERANLVLANINKPKMSSEANRNLIRGEVTFLRAFFYFLLVQNYGDVPLRTEPTASVTDVNYPRTPAKQVYDFIIKEMTAAEGLVPEITAYNHASRITKSVVQGLLARVCLYKAGFPNNDAAQYAEALKWAKKVINSGFHALNPDYSQVFVNLVQNKYDTKESIWEAEFYTTGTTDTYGEPGTIGVNNGVQQNTTDYGYSPGSYFVQQSLYDKYDALDTRRDWAICAYRYAGGNTLTRQYLTTTGNDLYSRYIGKFRREFELVASKIKNQTGTNAPLLRYSDVLLMAAEAENEVNGPTAFAIDCINQVRRRAYAAGKELKSITVSNGGSGYTSAPAVTISAGTNSAGLEPATATAVIAGGKVIGITLNFRGTYYAGAPVITISGGGGSGATATAALTTNGDADLSAAQTASKDALRAVLRDERSRELCFEGFRRLDLVRWHYLLEGLQEVVDYGTNVVVPPSARSYALNGPRWATEKNFYLPVPLREMSLNKLLVQNPGW